MYYAEGTYEPIIDQATFDKAQERLKMLAQQAATRKEPTRSAFSGLIRCGLCGSTYKRVVAELTKRCIAENSQTAQNQEEYAARYNGFVDRYEKAKAQLEQLRTTKAEREAQADAIGAFMFEVRELDTLTEFDEKLWLTIIDTATVHANGRMTFKFHGGKTLTSY